jgi:hypothetical protein
MNNLRCYLIGGCSFFRKRRAQNEMISRRLYGFLLASLSIACAGPQGPVPIPTPVPTSPLPEPATPTVPNTKSWSFKYSPGSVSYQITRSAVIERADSINLRETTTNSAHESLTLEATEQGVVFTAVVDTFTTTTQSLIGPVRPVQLPIQISGLLSVDSLTINSQATDSCSPVNTVLLTDLHNLLVKFPAVLSPGVVWTDSISLRGCQSGVPTLSHILRSYIVSGEVAFEGQPVVLVLRTDTTQAQGEGGLQQHRVSINAIGTGTAAYYLNPETGQVTHLTLNQALDLGVTTTARAYQFKQSSKQEFRLAP